MISVGGAEWRQRGDWLASKIQSHQIGLYDASVLGCSFKLSDHLHDW